MAEGLEGPALGDSGGMSQAPGSRLLAFPALVQPRPGVISSRIGVQFMVSQVKPAAATLLQGFFISFGILFSVVFFFPV